MFGMLRQRGIAFHTFRPQNGSKCAKMVWCDLNVITGVEFLECVECWVSAAQHSTHSTHSDGQNSPKGAEIVWYELNMYIEGFFQAIFFSWKNLYIFYLASPDDFIHLRGGMGVYIHKFCGILGMCGMLRQRRIAFHTFQPQNCSKCAKMVWCDLNVIIGVEFLECVECWVSAA